MAESGQTEEIRIQRMAGQPGGSSPRGSGGAVAGPEAIALPIGLSLAVLVLAAVAALIMYQTIYAERIYLGVSTMGIDLGGLTADQAKAAVVARYDRFAKTPIVLRYQGREWKATPTDLGMRVRVDDTIARALAAGREGNVFDRLGGQLASLRIGSAVAQPVLEVDAAKRSAFLAQVAKEIDQTAVSAEVQIKPGPQVVIQKGKTGQRLNVDATGKLIDQSISSLAGVSVDLVVDQVPSGLTDVGLAPVKAQAEKMVSAPVVLKFGDRSWSIARQQIASLIVLKEDQVASGGKQVTVAIDEVGLTKIVAGIAADVNLAALNARFDYTGGQLKSIGSGADGRQVDNPATVAAIKAALAKDDRTLSLPVVTIKPKVGPGDAGKLGVQDLIQQASTPYNVGTAERQFNIELAASRLNGVVLAPGDVFSFNREVGEVSYKKIIWPPGASTEPVGYKQGFAITQNEQGQAQTIPSEGGGICQVATTLFQSAFWAGYQIVERNWHLYWIPRYGEPPTGIQGLDATIDQAYDDSGKLINSVDLKFKNNTDNYLLIQARTDKRNLTFQLYGVKPKWQVKVQPPKIENVVKTDATMIRQPEPSFAPGFEMQVESAQDGFQATIVRTVLQDGKVLEDHSFVSVYQPAHNVTLYGPKPDQATPKPGGTPVANPDRPAVAPTATRPPATPTPKP